MINQLIQERYFILRLLGTGGFGDTYLAKDLGRASNPLCIIKHLKPGSHTPAFLKKVRQLFQRQAEILRRLGDHDQMPALVGHFEQDDEFFIVHDYAEGHTLDVEFKVDYRWSESQTTDLLREVLEILSFAHSQGVVHGDVKPENLVRRYRDNRLVLVDFATVKQEQTQVITADGDVHVSIAVSTPGYAATPDGFVIPDYGRDVQAVGFLGIRALTGMRLESIPKDPETGTLIWSSFALANFEFEDFVNQLAHPDPQTRFTNAADALRGLLQLTNFYAPVSVAAMANSSPRATTLLEPPPETIETTPPVTFDPALPTPSVHGELLTAAEMAVLDQQITSDGAITRPKSQSAVKSVTVPTLLPRQKLWVLGGVGIAALAGLGIIGAGWNFATAPSEWQAVLDQARQEQAQGNFTACQTLISQIPADETEYNQAMGVRIQCTLGPAEQLEQAGELPQALALLGKIPATDPAHTAAQELLGQWSDRLLSQASQAYLSGDLNQALALAQTIPSSSPSYAVAQDALASWQGEFSANQNLLAQSRRAFDQQQWEEAIQLAQQVRINGQPIPEDSDYYRQNIAPIVQNAATRLAAASPSPEANPENPPAPTSPNPATSTASLPPPSPSPSADATDSNPEAGNNEAVNSTDAIGTVEVLLETTP